MVKRAIKQVAAAASLRLMGVAVIAEIQSDYIRFRANGIRTIDEAMEIADQMTRETGILVTVHV